MNRQHIGMDDGIPPALASRKRLRRNAIAPNSIEALMLQEVGMTHVLESIKIQDRVGEIPSRVENCTDQSHGPRWRRLTRRTVMPNSKAAKESQDAGKEFLLEANIESGEMNNEDVDEKGELPQAKLSKVDVDANKARQLMDDEKLPKYPILHGDGVTSSCASDTVATDADP